jgi:hypothetical protein
VIYVAIRIAKMFAGSVSLPEGRHVGAGDYNYNMDLSLIRVRYILLSRTSDIRTLEPRIVFGVLYYLWTM